MMTQHRKQITREQYERAIANNRIILDVGGEGRCN